MAESEIQDLEAQIFELTARLNELKRQSTGAPVGDYTFRTADGTTTLSALFGSHDRLLVIHNMGEKCRYCTLWADGFNGFLPHLEDAMSVVLASKDEPDVQRTFANSRGWRFRLVSHADSDYSAEQSVHSEYENAPGAVVYERRDGQIFRKNACQFGPGDQYCSLWNLLGLAGLDEGTWTPQFRYWQRPEELEDGGENVAPAS